MGIDANRIIREKSGKRGAALMLLWLLAETDGEDAPPIPELAEIIGVSERHIKRLIEQCEQDGDLKVTRGRGRGHHSQYHVTYLLKGDTVPFQKTPRTNKTPENKGDIKGDTSPNTKGDIKRVASPFPSEIKGDIVQPPHTPHKDNINTQKGATPLRAVREVSANSEGLTAKTYIGRLLAFRLADLKTSKLPTEKQEAAAAKWMHGADWPIEKVKECYRDLKAQGWRQTPVTLITVKQHYLDWLNGNLNTEKKGNGSNGSNSGKSTKPSLTDRAREYTDYYGTGKAEALAG